MEHQCGGLFVVLSDLVNCAMDFTLLSVAGSKAPDRSEKDEQI